MEPWHETKNKHRRSSQMVHKRQRRQRIKILRVARCRLTISFRKGNPPGHHARDLKTPLRWPSFLVASRHERDDVCPLERNESEQTVQKSWAGPSTGWKSSEASRCDRRALMRQRGVELKRRVFPYNQGGRHLTRKHDRKTRSRKGPSETAPGEGSEASAAQG